jgi:hypothetical protein
MRVDHIELEFVEFIPPELEEGKLYVSMLYATTVHLCASGCGNKVVLPLSPAEWQMFFDGETVSLTPSVGNWEFPCRSHYWITGNAIKWAAPWSKQQIEAGRSRDQADLDSYFESRTAAPSSDQSTAQTTKRKGWLQRLLRR